MVTQNKTSYFVGSELKVVIQITCEGFSMDNDPWEAIVRQGSKEIRCSRGSNSVFDGENWVLLIDTSILGKGRYSIVVDIDVPDADFDDGYRHETYKQLLMLVNGI